MIYIHEFNLLPLPENFYPIFKQELRASMDARENSWVEKETVEGYVCGEYKLSLQEAADKHAPTYSTLVHHCMLRSWNDSCNFTQE